MDSYNPMQALKRRMFAMRNGVVADALRKGGSPFHIIFGINLPQLVEIAATTEHSKELAEQLWANSTTRESMLLAPMLMPREEFAFEDALRWGEGVQGDGMAEVADILCHRLLRHMPYAWELAERWQDKYIGVRLAFNMVATDPARAKAIAQSAMAIEKLRPLARNLMDEVEWLQG